MLGFALAAQETLHSVQLWASDTVEDGPITELLIKMGELIEKYTGKKTTLR
jgi:hypothetical protein